MHAFAILHMALSPSNFNNNNANGFNVNSTGNLNNNNVNNSNGTRPSVSLAPGTRTVAGDGTVNDPYIIE